MCLITFAYQMHDDYPLIMLANRDEFYARPTKNAHFWTEYPNILAGRDLQAGGTWLGVSQTGRLAAVTNFREMKPANPQFKSRGELTKQFLISNNNAQDFCADLAHHANEYDGYNLLLFDGKALWYTTNKASQYVEISPGIYSVSNHLFDTPWPKVTQSKQALNHLLNQPINPEELFDILSNQHQAHDHELPDTGIGLEFERLLSSCFIQSPTYGTRSSTVILYNKEHHLQFFEKAFQANGELMQMQCFEFDVVST